MGKQSGGIGKSCVKWEQRTCKKGKHMIIFSCDYIPIFRRHISVVMWDLDAATQGMGGWYRDLLLHITDSPIYTITVFSACSWAFQGWEAMLACALPLFKTQEMSLCSTAQFSKLLSTLLSILLLLYKARPQETHVHGRPQCRWLRKKHFGSLQNQTFVCSIL